MYVELSYWQVALAAALVVVNGAISVALKLGLERSLLIASVRTVLQLLLVGMVLESVFRWDRWYVVMGLACAMTLIAGVSAAGRNEWRYRGMRSDSVVAVWVSAWLVTAFALFAVMPHIEHWYQPQYAIPLLGMVLGNTLNGISVGLSTFTTTLVADREQVDGLLALGASRWEAAGGSIRRAVSTGMLPVINSMMIVGIVSLPGMMTGQLMTGMNPIEAVKYQIVIMFLIAAATTMGTVGVVLLCYNRMFNRDHQFVVKRLEQKKSV